MNKLGGAVEEKSIKQTEGPSGVQEAQHVSDIVAPSPFDPCSGPLHEATRIALLKNQMTLQALNVQSMTADDAAAHEHLLWMIEQCLLQQMTVDKISRWLGFVQGVMCSRGWLDMEQERAETRSVFHQAYQQLGWPIAKPLGRDA